MSAEGEIHGPPDIEQRTFDFALRIIRICRALDNHPGVSRTLGGQLLRSGTSVGANVTEGQAAQSRADFISKMNIALKEAKETHYWLRLVAAELMGDGQLDAVIQEADEIRRILGAIVRTARRNAEGA